MKSTRWVLIAGMMLSTTLFAQGLRQQGQDTQQIWLKFEKELGLQTRYAVDMEIEAMGMTMPSKMFRTEGKTRSEMTLPFMNMHMVALERPENGKTVRYSLFPDKKKYCLMPEEEKAKGAKKTFAVFRRDRSVGTARASLLGMAEYFQNRRYLKRSPRISSHHFFCLAPSRG